MSKKGFRKVFEKVKTAKGRKKSSTRWIQRHINDPYVIMAKKDGYRSRAAYKLLEIDEHFHVLEGAKSIIDLGCAPGGWLQVIERKTHSSVIIGLDLQEVTNLEKTHLLQGDFTADKTQTELRELLAQHNQEKVDLILSDMAAKSCGTPSVDHLRIMNLVESVEEFADKNLIEGGHLVVKLLRGESEHEFIKRIKQKYENAKFFKPEASYKDSSEIYLVARGFKGDIVS